MHTQPTTQELIDLKDLLESGNDMDTGDILEFFQSSGISLLNEILEYRKITEESIKPSKSWAIL